MNNDAATSKNNLDVLENSGVFRKPIACRTTSKNPATTNRVGQSGFTLLGMESLAMDEVFMMGGQRHQRPGLSPFLKIEKRKGLI